MGVWPAASPGFAQGQRSISPSSKKYEEFSWHEEVAFCVPCEIVLGSLWLSHSLRLSSIFSLSIFFFPGYEYDAAVQFTLETLQTLTQPHGLVVRPLLWLHPQMTRELSSPVPARTGRPRPSFIAVAKEALRISRAERSTIYLAGWD